jgi:hypothetical protein
MVPSQKCLLGPVNYNKPMKLNLPFTSVFNIGLPYSFVFQKIIGIVIGKTDVKGFPDRKS